MSDERTDEQRATEVMDAIEEGDAWKVRKFIEALENNPFLEKLRESLMTGNYPPARIGVPRGYLHGKERHR